MQFVETTGAWSYYQILKHCTDHIEFSMSGFPYTYSPFLRKTVGKYLLSKLLERGYMLPDGYNGQLETARIEGDDRLALSQLKAAIYSFRKFNKDFAIHPESIQMPFSPLSISLSHNPHNRHRHNRPCAQPQL